MKVGLVTSYMPPHLGGIERIAENLFTGYTDSGAEVRWVSSRAPADAPRREDRRTRVPCFNLVEDLLGVPVPIWGPTGWAEVKRLTQWKTPSGSSSKTRNWGQAHRRPSAVVAVGSALAGVLAICKGLILHTMSRCFRAGGEHVFRGPTTGT